MIEKNGKEYVFVEFSTKWVIKTKENGVSISYDVPKEICHTVDDLKEYVLKNEIF